MELDAGVLTLLILMVVAMWKVGDTLSELEARASQHLRKTRAGPDASGETSARGAAYESRSRGPAKDADSLSGDVARRLEDIRLADRSFDADRFLNTVCLVYETVVVAYANGDRDLLRDLMSADVYETFSQAIAAREKSRQRVELDVVRLERAVIVDAGVFNDLMQITVGLESEVVTATRNEAGKIVAGDPTRIITVSDYWTFAKEPTSRGPAWKIVRTEPQQADALSPENAEASLSEMRRVFGCNVRRRRSRRNATRNRA